MSSRLGEPGEPARRLATHVAFCFLALFAVAPAAADHTFSWGNPKPQGNPLLGLDFETTLVGWAVGTHGAVVGTTDGGVTWNDLTDTRAFSTDLEDVLALGAGELLAVGAPPGIFRSLDGGATWAVVPNPSTGRLRDLVRISASVLSAVGEAGQVVRSNDDGLTWSLMPEPRHETILEQFWFDAGTGYLVGTFVARRTIDGGQTWLPIPGVPENTNVSEVFFTSPLEGAILSDFGWWRTVNGGASWTFTMSPGGGPVYLGDTVPLTSEHWLMTTNLEGALLWETFDAGAHWDFRYAQEAGGFTDFDHLSDGRLVACTDLADLVSSTDAGATWTDATHSPSDGERVTLSSLAFLPNGVAYAGGRSSTSHLAFLRSTDEGASWTEVAPPSFTFSAMLFRDTTLGLIGGDDNVVQVTTDGGLTWTNAPLTHALPVPMRVFDFAAPAGGSLYAAAYGPMGRGTVFHSVDGGASWQRRDTGLPTNVGYFAIGFPDASNGFAGGGGALPALYRTTNAGASWTAVSTTGIQKPIFDMFWQSTTTGLVTTRIAPGGLYRTTNGGASWTQILTDPVRRISFRDPAHGVALFDGGNEVAVTSDGGVSWTRVSLPLGPWADTVFDRAGGFVAAGAWSSILLAADEGTVDVEHADDGVRGAIDLRVLSPIGPPSRVSFETIEPGIVRLELFDVRGRAVRTLALGWSAARARSEVTWDGRDDTGRPVGPGIYFLRLAAPGGRAVAPLQVLR